MNKIIENRIAKLVKQNQIVRDSLDALLSEYAEQMAAVELKLKKRKDQKDSLSERERESHKILCELLETEKPLNILVRLFKTEQTETGWRVLSSDGATWYEIDSDISFCPCPFRSKTGERCPHIKAVQLLTRIKYRRPTSTLLSSKGASV